jgi:cell division protein ZipA
VNELRWILLILGIIVLAVIYIFGRKEQLRRRRRRREEADGLDDATGVSLDTHSEYDESGPTPERFDMTEAQTEESLPAAPEPTASAAPPPSVEPVRPPTRPKPTRRPLGKDKIISLYVVAHRPALMRGEAIRLAAEALELEHGDMQIFHRTVERHGRRQIVFSMASAVPPGTFDLDNLQGFTTPGLALFMQLPGPIEGLKAFNAMLDCAQHLAVELDAELRDETRSVLTSQAIDHLREEIQLFSLRTARARPYSA